MDFISSNNIKWWIPLTDEIVLFFVSNLNYSTKSSPTHPILLCVLHTDTHMHKHATSERKDDSEHNSRWALIKGFTLVQSSQSSFQRPKALLEPPHTHINAQQSKQRECSRLQRACIGCQAYRQTVAFHSDCKHTFLCPESHVCPPLNHTHCEHRVREMCKASYVFLALIGVPSFRDHGRNPHPALRARAKERRPWPDGIHQDPHLLALWHEGTRQEVRPTIPFREHTRFRRYWPVNLFRD